MRRRRASIALQSGSNPRRASIRDDYQRSGRTLTFFLDSSAFAKLFVREPGSIELLSVFEPLQIEEKAISSLASVEVHSAIRRRLRSGDLSDVSATSAIGALTAELAMINQYAVTPAVIALAIEVIDRQHLRSLDAIQLATAILAKNSIVDSGHFQFVSSDYELLAAATAEGLATWDPATT